MFCICDTLAEEEAASTIKWPILSPGTPVDDDVRELEKEVPTEPFLGEQREEDKGKKTLVLDLDETLVHSTFQAVDDCQYVSPVEIEGNTYNVYVYLRPGALEVIEKMSKIYEIVIYTASLRIVPSLLPPHP